MANAGKGCTDRILEQPETVPVFVGGHFSVHLVIVC